MSESHNIAAALPRLARERPDQVAMRCPGRDGRYDVTLTYAQLDARSDAIAAGLALRGIVRGTRTVVMLRPTPEFFLVMFALFKAGAIPVLVDPGIDKRALKICLDEAQAQAFIGVPLAHAARVALGWARSARIRITTATRPWLADATLQQVERNGSARAPSPTMQPDETAAILFTSGSTGVPKGVVYRHRHLLAQVALLRDAFGITRRRHRHADVPAVRAVRSRARADLDHSRHGSDAAGARGPTPAAAGDRALRGRPVVRVARADGGAGPARRRFAHAQARDVRRCIGAGGRGRGDARAAARRRAVLDAVRRDRMPAGRGDRRPRARTPRANAANRAAASASVARCRRTWCASSPSTMRPSRSGATRCWSSPDRWARSPSPGRRDGFVFQPRRGDAPGEDPRTPGRRQRTRRASHGRPGLRRSDGLLWFCGRKIAARGHRCADHPVHRTGRAGVQRASRSPAHGAGRRRPGRRAATGPVRGTA